MIAGVDEAGRGPVLGPLVVAAVLATSQRAMRNLGVDDSKKLTPAAREALVPRIHAKALAVEVRIIDVDELNRRMDTQTLNEIEVDAFAELLARLRPKDAILDACDVDEARFGRLVATGMTRHTRIAPTDTALISDAAKPPKHATGIHEGGPCKIRSEHAADARHAVVAAASIIAKVERDAHISRLAKEYGDIGSGYASDPATKRFLAHHWETHKTLPGCVRKHWETARRLVPTNRTLGDFG